jgi:hypothetical protein
VALRYVFNAITGNFDLINDSSAPVTARYVDTFNATTDWTLNGSVYEITIDAAAHGKGADPEVAVFEFVSGNYEKTNVGIVINNINDVIISVSSSPDLRFIGKIVIL